MSKYILIYDIVDIKDNSIVSSGGRWVNIDKILYLQLRSNKSNMPYTIITLDNGEVLRTEATVDEVLEAMGAEVELICSQIDDGEEDD